MPTKAILDVDTGTDDAVALMLAALSPDLELVGVTTVNGNNPVDVCTENTLRVLDHIGVRTPVYTGMPRPIARPDFPIPRSGSFGMHGEYLDLPPSRTKKQSQHAVNWLIDTYKRASEEIVLIAVAPLSNIATAITMEPRILENIPEIVMMGGAHETGNDTASAEFNVWADPEAARVVINCGRPLRLVMLDATNRALVSKDDCAMLRRLGTPAAVAAASFAEQRIAWYDAEDPMPRPGTAPLHDALAVCTVIEPAVVKTAFVNVDVETQGELTLGRTVCDFRHWGKREPNAHVALGADEPRFVQMLLDILGREATRGRLNPRHVRNR